MRIKRLIELINTFTRYNQMDPDCDEDDVEVCCPGRNMTGEITVEEFGHETLEKLLKESMGIKNDNDHKKVPEPAGGKVEKKNDQKKPAASLKVKKLSEHLQKETPDDYNQKNEERYVLGFDDYIKLTETRGTPSNVQSYFGKLASGATDYDREEDDWMDDEE